MPTAEPAATYGGFTVLHEIGEGGMGQVYLGQNQDGRQAAIKILKADRISSLGKRRFRREAAVLSGDFGGAVACCIDSDIDSDPPWIAMEFIDGPDLQRHVKKHGKPPASPTLVRIQHVPPSSDGL